MAMSWSAMEKYLGQQPRGREAYSATVDGKRAWVFRELLSMHSVSPGTWQDLLDIYQRNHQAKDEDMEQFTAELCKPTLSQATFTQAMELLKPIIGDSEVFERLRRYVEVMPNESE